MISNLLQVILWMRNWFCEWESDSVNDSFSIRKKFESDSVNDSFSMRKWYCEWESDIVNEKVILWMRDGDPVSKNFLKNSILRLPMLHKDPSHTPCNPPTASQLCFELIKDTNWNDKI